MPKNARGCMSGGAGGPGFQESPSNSHVSVYRPRPDPPNSTTAWRASSYTISAPVRASSAGGAGGPFDQAEPSHSHVSFEYGGQTSRPSAVRASPPNMTSLPMSGSKAM